MPASPSLAAHSWRLVLGPRTQASLLSGSTDPSWEGEEGRGDKAPLQRPHRTGLPTAPLVPALCLPRRAPLQHVSGWLRRLVSCTAP